MANIGNYYLPILDGSNWKVLMTNGAGIVSWKYVGYFSMDTSKIATKYDLQKRWEKEVTNDAENNWTIPFNIQSYATIIYNGAPLRPTQWAKLDSVTLLVNLNVRKYDHLVLIN
jgi:hypothetical protein